MFKNLKKSAKRMFLGAVAAICLIGGISASASDFSCSAIKDINGNTTSTIFCTSSTSSAGFYYFWYDTATGSTTWGPNQ